MLTLIETNEQLNIALSKYHRALLQARKTTPSPLPSGPPLSQQQNQFVGGGQYVYNQPPQPPNVQVPATNGSGFGQPNFPRNEQFSPPPGPPPGAKGAFQSQQGYTTAQNNGVPAENPFADDAAYEQPQNQYSLFGKANNTPATQQLNPGYGSPPPQQTDATANYPAQLRPGGYNATPSYLHRQESAANHITMHGASPPQEPTR